MTASTVHYKRGMLLKVTEQRGLDVKTPMTREEQEEWLGQKTTWHDSAGEPWLVPRWNYTRMGIDSTVLITNTRPGIRGHVEVMVGNLVGLATRTDLNHYTEPIT